MGDFKVRKLTNPSDRRKMYQFAIDDINVFEQMLKDEVFDDGPLHIGAEQELCVVDKLGNPSKLALDILYDINDEHYTSELALFNLEINLDPFPLSGSSFSQIEQSLLDLLEKGRKVANMKDSEFFLTGILPTLKFRHLLFDYMTPIERYQTLSSSLFEIRGNEFEVHLQGVDEINLSLNSILFEACNTSFQLHLQIRPEDFVDQHNWSQMIAGPVLAACANSPMLFGNELWSETRIALFKQSIDTRSSNKYIRKKVPRVYFGDNWLEQSAAELWKNDIMRFPLVVTSDSLKDSKEIYNNGKIPDLRGIRLHNGTTYTWNRLCYGFSKETPHLRIECRYIPSGPTVIDEIANFAFWIGLMRANPPDGVKFWKSKEFKHTKNNFIKAARTGLNTIFEWYGNFMPAKELILDHLIPLAESGLKNCNIDTEDIDKYLSVIRRRIEKGNTGAQWTVRNFRNISKKCSGSIAEKEITQYMIDQQKKNIPIAEWNNIECNYFPTDKILLSVEDIMSTDIFSVGEDSSIEIIKSILLWNDIHHLPVENNEGDLIGIITDGVVRRLGDITSLEETYAKDIMIANPLCANADDTVVRAIQTMEENDLSGLPVVHENKLVGIVTLNDIDS